MKTNLRSLLSLTVLCVYGFAIAGCGGNATDTPTVAQTASDSDDHDHDDHDHDHEGHDHDHDHDHDDHDGHDHDDHDHPAHGPNGGHMVELSDGADVEWVMEEEEGQFTVLLPEDAGITGVAMKTKIADTENVYAFEASDEPAGSWSTTSPELATAVMMGEAVKTTLVVTTEDGESTATVKYHKH